MADPGGYSESDLLRMIDARYTQPGKAGYPDRYMIGHHVAPPSTFVGLRIADAIVLDRNGTYFDRNSRDPRYPRGYRAVHGFEVKVSRGDWLRELRDPSKAEHWVRYCHHWWVVAPKGVVKLEELPPNWGLLQPAGARLRAEVKAPLLTAEDMPSPFVIAITAAVRKRDTPMACATCSMRARKFHYVPSDENARRLAEHMSTHFPH